METAGSHALFDNLHTEARVRSALRQGPSTRDIRIAIKADQFRLTLAGVVATAAEKRRVAEVAAAVAGVTEVSNDVVVAAARASRHREG